MQRSSHYKKAFTLVEILIVVIIIAALASMIVPKLTGRAEKAKISIARTDISSNLATALELYQLDNGSFPRSLQSLIVNPGGLSTWSGPYIKAQPLDPWGKTYQYRYPSLHGKDYDLYSLGPDGLPSSDDITNWGR